MGTTTLDIKKRKADVYDRDYQTDCEFYADVLVKNGVAIEAILHEDKSGHTKDNAFFSRRVTDEKGLVIKKAIICCKSYALSTSISSGRNIDCPG